MNVEDKLFPENGELKQDKDGSYSVQLIDAELDPIECSFNNSGTIKIDTGGIQWVTLTVNNLEDMIHFIMISEDLYEEQLDN